MYDDFWAGRGLQAVSPTGNEYLLAYETPCMQWPVRNLALLPGHWAIFQLGSGSERQIALLDLPTRRIAILALGEGPAVALPAK